VRGFGLSAVVVLTRRPVSDPPGCWRRPGWDGVGDRAKDQTIHPAAPPSACRGAVSCAAFGLAGAVPRGSDRCGGQ
jgi:hypothetical protein